MKSNKNRFQTLEHTHVLFQEWDSLPLTAVMSSSSGESNFDRLKLLLERSSIIQASILDKYLNNTIQREKLLNFVKEVAHCRIAYHNPANIVQDVISDLYASLAQPKRPTNHTSAFQPSLYVSYVDRR